MNVLPPERGLSCCTSGVEGRRIDGRMDGGGCKVSTVPVLNLCYNNTRILVEDKCVYGVGVTILGWTRGKHCKLYPQMRQDKIEGV